MKSFSLLFFLLVFQTSYGQVTLDANGPGDTYALITSVLAPDYDPIEAPDCSHSAFGDHIDELFDADLNMNVFRFHLHTTPDDDRCIVFDRQRNEIKSYDKSPDNLLGVEGEQVVYKWKFKLPAGFQSSPNFTHIHQLKSVGGEFASKPMYTLTTRKGSPDQLELRYAETDDQVTLTKTDLAPFIDTWLDVTETIKYGTEGTYAIEIKKVSTDEVLMSYSNSSIINWREGAEFVRPKWGIYRSLINAQDLRDEMLLYANFSIEELGTSTPVTSLTDEGSLVVYLNPTSKIIYVSGYPESTETIQLVSINGWVVKNHIVGFEPEIYLDVSKLPTGNYIVNIKGNGSNQSRKVFVIQ